MTIALRPMRQDDSARVLAWRNTPAVAAYMYTDHPISVGEHARWFATVLGAEDRRYWIIEMDDAPVGLANLARIDAAARRCEWAYYLADPSTRGKGVGAVVEYMVLQHVFGALKLNKLWCEVLLENETVWRLHESFGFRREAHFRQHVWKGGQFKDVVGLGLLSEDWLASRAACEARLLAKGHDLAGLIIRAIS